MAKRARAEEGGTPADQLFTRRRTTAPAAPDDRGTLLADLTLNAPTENILFGDGGSEGPPMERMTYDDLMDITHKDCFACQRINSDSLRENEYFYKLMKLYTDNSTATCRESVYRLVKEYFDEEIRPLLIQDEDDEGIKEWPLEVIREHFLRHSNYATDEVIRQINITTGLRNHMMNYLVQVDHTKEKVKYDINYIKTMISLNQEIRKLRSMKKELPNLIGYDHVLNY
jgi:hypothetical protein